MSDSNRFGSYNILIPRPDKKEKGHLWENRKEELIQTIINNTDVIGLQEYDTSSAFDQGKYVEEELFSRGWQGYLPQYDESSEFTDEFHHRLPIFWREDIFTKVNCGIFKLSGFSLMEQYATPIVEDRYCSWVDLAEKVSGKQVRIYNLHQQQHTVSASSAEKTMAYKKQYDGLVNLSSHIKQVEGNVIVLGDFNNIDVPSWFIHNTGLTEAWDKVAADFAFNKQFNSFHNWLVPLNEESEHIDHILVSPSVEVSRVEVVLSDASDHFPLVATVSL